jgi:hypothetical protein
MDLRRTCPDSLLIWANKRDIVWQRPRVWKAISLKIQQMAISNWHLAKQTQKLGCDPLPMLGWNGDLGWNRVNLRGAGVGSG